VTPAGLIEDGRLRAAAAELAASLSIKAASLDLPARNLSGGNQQKVVLAKWLLNRPTVFILDEPTRGVDVGAKYEIYAIADGLAAASNGVLFISSELDERIALCDRILVMSRGEIWGAFADKPFDYEAIMRSAFREGSLAEPGRQATGAAP
jgi:ribose transport system ATP-binding protein